MSEVNSNKKGVNNANGSRGKNELITLINPKETLVKKEQKSVVVRNSEGKLVRRTDPDGVLDEIYTLIQEGEVLVREEESRIIVKNKAGKLVARRKPETKRVEDKSRIKKAEENLEIKKESSKSESSEDAKPEHSGTSDLRSRLLSKHSFLSRMERGEKIGVAQEIPNADFKPEEISFDDIEEIEDDEIEELAPDAEVLELEDAITKDNFDRSIGKNSSKGFRAGQTGTHIESGAYNPNEKPSLKASTSKGLVGDYVLATPERINDKPDTKKKKNKKERKPVKPWVVAVTLVGIYLVAMATYFFVGFNFGKKQISLVLYYIDISEDAKLEYYDGEQFV